MPAIRISRALPVAYTAFFLAAFIAFAVWGRGLLADMYNGVSIPALNRLITHQAENSLGHYIAKFLFILTTGYAAGLAGIICFLRPEKTLAFISRLSRAATGVVFAGYAAYVLSMFWTPDFFSQPVSQDDYILHYAEGLGESHLIKNYGTVYGYNPFRNAGIEHTGVDNFWAGLFFFALGWTGLPALVFNMAVLAAFFVPLVLAYFTGRNLLADRAVLVLYCAVTAFMLAGFLELREFLRSGVYGFVLSSSFSLYIWSLVHRYLDEQKIRLLAAATAWGAFALWVHPLTALTFCALALPLLVLHRKRITFRVLLLLGAGTAAVILVNLPWIVPYAKTAVSLHSYHSSFGQTSLSLLLHTLRRDRAFVVLLVLFALFCAHAVRTRSLLCGATAVSSLIFFVMAFFGSSVGLAAAEPGRFIIPLGMVLALAAALMAREMLVRRNVMYFAAIVLLFLSLATPPHALRIGFSHAPVAQKIIDFVKTKVPQDGRLLVQESLGHAYFGSHFSAALPALTNREVLANSGHALEPHFPRFVGGMLFGRPAATLGDSLLGAYLKLYAVTHVLVCEESGRRLFDSLPDFKPVFREHPYVIFEFIGADKNRLHSGSARVAAEYGKIRIQNAATPSLILKYHYYPTLKARPSSVTIAPVTLLDDPVPFIRVQNAACGNFEIRQ